nr:unnamed protein product [Digitaria exilis]
MDVRSNYPLPAHPGIRGSIPIVGSTDSLLLRTKKNLGHLEPSEARGLLVPWTKPHDRVPPHIGHDSHRNTWRERSRFPPRREEAIVLLIRGSNLGPSKGFDKGPRSTESGIIDGTLEIEPRSSNVRGPRPQSNEPTLIERGMDVHSNHPLPAQPGIHGSIPPREARVASSSTPSNRERKTLRECQPLSQGLGGYTRGCASAPPRILGTHEEIKASKASTNSSLRGIKLHPCEGSGATVGYLRKGYPNLDPKLLGMKAHNDIGLALQAQQRPTVATNPRHPSRSRWTTTLERGFPPRSRLSGLEGDFHPRASLSVSFEAWRARACGPSSSRLCDPSIQIMMTLLCGQKAGLTAPRHHLLSGEDIGQIHSRQPNPASSTPPSKAASKETMERRTQDTTLDAVNCHEKEGRYQSWKARFPLTHARNDKHMYSHPVPLVYKRGREAQAKGKQQDTQRTQGPRSSSPSPTLLVNPYHEQHATRCIAPLLDVRPRGRNQDKTPSLTLAIRETSG